MNPTYFETEFPLPAKMVVLPLRCTVVKLNSGENVMISPIDFSPRQLAEIKKLGPITHIVAPCLIHHLFLNKAIERFKPREVWGPPTCREVLPEVPFTHVFGHIRWPFELHLPFVFIEGVPRINEVVFYHVATKTMICADLCFNLQKPKGWAAPLMLRLLGTYKRFGVSRVQARFMKDRDAFERSVKDVLKWNFETIAMGHGELLVGHGRDRLEAALRERGYLKS
ncbi:MAG: DUF4336 domain-containing protein [Bdellovibrionota bacterium]